MSGISNRTVDGIDASRRVGWAKYFDALEEMVQREHQLLGVAVSFALDLLYHERLHEDDSRVVRAKHFIEALEAEPETRGIVETVKRKSGHR